MRDDCDELDELDDVITIWTQVEQIEANDKVEIVEHFISLFLNDNEWSWRIRLIFIYQKLKDNVKRQDLKEHKFLNAFQNHIALIL